MVTQVKRPALRSDAVNGTFASHAAMTRPGPRDPQTLQARGSPEPSKGPSPCAPPRWAGGLRRRPGRRAWTGLAAGPSSGPGTGTPGPTPGFTDEHPSIPLPAPRRPVASRSPSIPHRERSTHRLLHGGRHLGTGLPREAGRAATARFSSLPSLTPCWPGTPVKYNTVSTFPRVGSSTKEL